MPVLYVWHDVVVEGGLAPQPAEQATASGERTRATGSAGGSA